MSLIFSEVTFLSENSEGDKGFLNLSDVEGLIEIETKEEGKFTKITLKGELRAVYKVKESPKQILKNAKRLIFED